MSNNYTLDKAKTKILTERWAKHINIVESKLMKGKDLSYDRKAALAKLLENTQQYIKHVVAEGVQSSDIGQYKRFALDLVTTVVPNLIAYDIVSVQPIDNRVGMINYIKYIYNTTKGTTQAGTEFASALYKSRSDENYTTNVINGESVITDSSDNQTFTATLAWKPIIPGSVEIKHGNVVIKDDGLGGLTAAAGLEAGATIDYDTGAISYKLSVADAVNSPLAVYSYNNEYIPANDIPEIGLKVESVPVVARTRRLKAYYSFEASFELQKEYGQDMQELLNTQAAAEIAHEIDIEICNDLYRHANAGNELVWSKTQPKGVNLIDHYDSFVVKLDEGSAAIRQATRRVEANFVILGTSAAVVAKSCRQFTPSGVTGAVGPYFLGTIGNYKLYVNPEYDPNAFVLGFKGDNLLNAGYVYAPYMPILTTDLVQLEDMAGRKGWATMYAKAILNDKMYIKGRITA